MSEIHSESSFFWKTILFILILPFLLVGALFSEKARSRLKEQGEFTIQFIFEAKLTIILIIINILVFISMPITLMTGVMTQAGWESLFFRPEHILQLKIVPIIASWFIHGSIAHILGNCLFLFIFGRVVEKNFGSIKMFLIYFGAAIVSSLFSGLLFNEGGIGASGAIMGLVSAAMLIEPFYLTYLMIGIPLPIMIVGWLQIITDVTGVLYQVNDNVGHFAHLGGFIAVSLMIFLFSQNEREKMRVGFYINIGTLIVGSILYLFFIMK